MDSKTLLVAASKKFQTSFTLALTIAMQQSLAHLFDKADKNLHPKIQRQILDARGLLMSNQHAIQKQINQQLVSLLADILDVAEGKIKPHLSREDKTKETLNDLNSHENELRIDIIARRFQANAQEQFRELNVRMAVLFAPTIVAGRDMPLHPRVIAKSLILGLAQSPFDNDFAVLIGDQLAEDLLGEIPYLFKNVNGYLQEAGVLASVEYKAPAEEVTTTLSIPELKSQITPEITPETTPEVDEILNEIAFIEPFVDSRVNADIDQIVTPNSAMLDSNNHVNAPHNNQQGSSESTHPSATELSATSNGLTNATDTPTTTSTQFSYVQHKQTEMAGPLTTATSTKRETPTMTKTTGQKDEHEITNLHSKDTHQSVTNEFNYTNYHSSYSNSATVQYVYQPSLKSLTSLSPDFAKNLPPQPVSPKATPPENAVDKITQPQHNFAQPESAIVGLKQVEEPPTSVDWAKESQQLEEALRTADSDNQQGKHGAHNANFESDNLDFNLNEVAHNSAIFSKSNFINAAGQPTELGDTSAIEHEKKVNAITARLFDFIKKNQQLPERELAKSKRLQSAILKLALMDKTLAQFNSQAAQALIMRVEDVANGLQKIDSNNIRILSEMSRIVDALEPIGPDLSGLNAESSAALNAPLFGNMLNKLEQFIDVELKIANDKVSNVVELLREVEQRSQRLYTASSKLEEILTDLNVSPFLRNFLVQSWSKVIERVERQSTPDSIRFRLFVPNLLWSVQPKNAAKDRTMLLQVIPNLVPILREGMCLLMWGEDKQQEVLNWMVDAHTTVMRAPVENQVSATLKEVQRYFYSFIYPEVKPASELGELKLSTMPRRKEVAPKYAMDRTLLAETIVEFGARRSQIKVVQDLDEEPELLSSLAKIEAVTIAQAMTAPSQSSLSKNSILEPEALPESQVEKVLERLKAGVLIDIQLADSPTRARLHWVNRETSTLILTMAQQDVPTIVSVRMFVRMLNLKRVQFVEDAALFEPVVQYLLASSDADIGQAA